MKDILLKEETAQYRLYKNGVNVIKNSELIALVIGGNSKRSAQESAENLLQKFNGNLSKLAGASVKELANGDIGLGNSKAAKLAACIELGKRISSFSESEEPAINTPNDVFRILGPEMRYLKQEVFKVILLNTKNKLISIKTISTGLIDVSLVHSREVFHHAILEMASSILLVHNHPSGSPIPSAQDLEITKTLIKSGEIIGIDIIDHIIIAGDKYLSMKEKKLI